MPDNFLERAAKPLDNIHTRDEMVQGVADKAFIGSMSDYASLERIRQEGLRAGKKRKTRAKFWKEICKDHPAMLQKQDVYVESMGYFEYLMLHYTDEYTGAKGEQHTFLMSDHMDQFCREFTDLIKNTPGKYIDDKFRTKDFIKLDKARRKQTMTAADEAAAAVSQRPLRRCCSSCTTST